MSDTPRFETVEIRHIKLPLAEPFETSFGRLDHRDLVVLGGKRDSEWYYGEASTMAAPLYNHETVQTNLHILEDFIAPALQQCESIPDYHDHVSRFRGHPFATAAGDFLLHHQQSVETGTPLKSLIGGVHDEARCGVSIGIPDSSGGLVDQIDRYLSAGYQRIKVKIRPGDDIDLIEQVREHYPDIPLMADANAAYTLDDADRLQALDRFDLQMVEQPLAHGDLVDHAALADRIDTPICLDESITSAADVRRAARIGACDIVNLKPQRVGGLHPSQRINEACEAHGMEMWIGGVIESGIGASFQIAAAALSAVSYPGDIAASERYFEQDVITPPITVEDGIASIPDIPGLAGAVDRDRLDAVTERTINV